MAVLGQHSSAVECRHGWMMKDDWGFEHRLPFGPVAAYLLSP